MKSFALKVTCVVAIVAGMGLAIALALPVVLVGFAAILYGLALSGLAELTCRVVPVPYKLSLASVFAISSLLAVAVIALLGPGVAAQIDRLTELLPAAAERLVGELEGYRWGRWLLDEGPSAGDIGGLASDGLLASVARVFSTAAGVIANVVVIVVVGLYLAIDPRRYKRMAIRLVPPARRQRAGEVLSATGSALRRWLLGRLASMVIVGVLTTLGLWLIGVPLPVTLGLS